MERVVVHGILILPQIFCVSSRIIWSSMVDRQEEYLLQGNLEKMWFSSVRASPEEQDKLRSIWYDVPPNLYLHLSFYTDESMRTPLSSITKMNIKQCNLELM